MLDTTSVVPEILYTRHQVCKSTIAITGDQHFHIRCVLDVRV